MSVTGLRGSPIPHTSFGSREPAADQRLRETEQDLTQAEGPPVDATASRLPQPLLDRSITECGAKPLACRPRANVYDPTYEQRLVVRELERPGGCVPEKLGYAFWHRSSAVGWALAVESLLKPDTIYCISSRSRSQ